MNSPDNADSERSRNCWSGLLESGMPAKKTAGCDRGGVSATGVGAALLRNVLCYGGRPGRIGVGAVGLCGLLLEAGFICGMCPLWMCCWLFGRRVVGRCGRVRKVAAEGCGSQRLTIDGVTKTFSFERKNPAAAATHSRHVGSEQTFVFENDRFCERGGGAPSQNVFF